MKISLHWSIGGSGTNPGHTGWNLINGGWPRFIREQIIPAIEWAQSCGHTPQFVIHHAFGCWEQPTEPMRITGWEEANAAKATFLTRDFSSKQGFPKVTDRYSFYGYAGGLDLTEGLKWASIDNQVQTIIRNLRPYQKAGFAGMYIDAAENAINKPFKHPFNSRQNTPASVDCITLAIADAMFPQETGIEAVPRNYTEFVPLRQRPVMLLDEEYVFRYGSKNEELLKSKYGYRGRNTNWQGLGYTIRPDSRTVRTIPWFFDGDPANTDDTDRAAELIHMIAEDGHIPGFNPYPFISQGVTL